MGNSQLKVAVIGLGYVGLPLALTISNTKTCALTGIPLCRKVIGYDNNTLRVDQLKESFDASGETDPQSFPEDDCFLATSNIDDMAGSDIYIVCVPTPIDSAKQPDLAPLKSASKIVATVLSAKSPRFLAHPIVIFESTVYPGVTEDICLPLIEKHSGLTLNKDFFAGFSPERVVPGLNSIRLPDIVKVTSGSNDSSAELIDKFYGSFVVAGTHKAPSIRVAEASKILENTQRDTNIALINEFAMILHHDGISWKDVIDAASTKWNFHRYTPGLVGGHCIGVDPYYIIHKADNIGHYSQLIRAARRINDSMAGYVSTRIVNTLVSLKTNFKQSCFIVYGVTYKPDCSDMRSSKAIEVIKKLHGLGIHLYIVDHFADPQAFSQESGLVLHSDMPTNRIYDGLILLVPHTHLMNSLTKLSSILTESPYIFDLASVLPASFNASTL